MAETVKLTVRQLLESIAATIESLDQLSEDDLKQASEHVCAQGGDVMKLITNDIDHELTHAGHILDARYETKSPRSTTARLLSEWLEARARFIGSLIGLSDEEFGAPMAEGEWSYRQAAEHVLLLELDSLRSIHEGRSAAV